MERKDFLKLLIGGILAMEVTGSATRWSHSLVYPYKVELPLDWIYEPLRADDGRLIDGYGPAFLNGQPRDIFITLDALENNISSSTYTLDFVQQDFINKYSDRSKYQIFIEGSPGNYINGWSKVSGYDVYTNKLVVFSLGLPNEFYFTLFVAKNFRWNITSYPGVSDLGYYKNFLQTIQLDP